MSCLTHRQPWAEPGAVHFAASLDPKILATAFGLDPQAALYYAVDRVDLARLASRDRDNPHEPTTGA